MTRATFVLGFLGVLLVVPAASQVETIVLRPAEAAGIAGEVDGVVEPRILLTFDLSTLPEGAHIQYAGLMLSDESGLPWESPYVPVIIGALTREWDGSSASWDGPAGGESWENPGGDWDSGLTAYRVLVLRAGSPAKFLVTHMVREWLSEDAPNYGLIAMVQDVEDLADALPYFNVTELRPSLQVRYFVLSKDAEDAVRP